MHRVGRTGRAGRKGTAYTFISAEEEQHAPTLIKALTQSKQKVRASFILCGRMKGEDEACLFRDSGPLDNIYERSFLDTSRLLALWSVSEGNVPSISL